MPTNINCKKKWHPSRYETLVRVKEAEKAVERSRIQEDARRERGRRETLESEIHGKYTERMQWML
ncbi:hypothetical protein KMI_04g07930 [Encephalitozoon hellem]|nr:hypothetical protein KMI_04g07930 [Encephalitozoon hellem]